MSAHRHFALPALLAALAACSGGNDEAAAPPAAPAAATGLAGKVAVGVVLQQARLRIVDADGIEIARDVPVAADGSYSVPAVSGRAPFRIEACGYAGGDYVCLHSVATALGTANVTPLTEAAALLAGGAAPGTLMEGNGAALTATSLSEAQVQLRTGLAGAMAGNVPAGFDFVTGALDAGSRTGYDRLLDTVGVATGVDGGTFVQITPRLGSGNLYLQPGSSTGSVTIDSGAAALSLDGLDALFVRMTSAVANATACGASGEGGLAAALATNARLGFGGHGLSGPTAVAGALCALFAEQGLWGARFVSPTLGRCETGQMPVRCGVAFAIETPDGARMTVSNGMGVQRQAAGWQFLGDLHPLQIGASSRAQRTRRVDGEVPVDRYERALALDIQAAAGLACARVSQRDAAGAEVTVAYFKPMGAEAERLSAWRDGNGGRSLDPAVGQLRSSDDTWLMLPAGSEGDAVVRNFFRGGRLLTVSTFADAACSTPWTADGRSEFIVEVDGVPPVWSAMATLPWPELTAASASALSSLSLAPGAGGELPVAWTFAHGRAGISEMSLCTLEGACGDGEAGRIGQRGVSPALATATLTLRNGEAAVGAWRMLSLHGGGPDRLGLQANFTSCRGTEAGRDC
ncbi:MAG: hypothetical protein JNM33_01500 [Rubrivivax sp.]|nr:hypothetical protein [Rubrivivax sp.]